MQWLKRIGQYISKDTDAADLMLGIAVFGGLIVFIGLIVAAVKHDDATNQRREYREIMEKYCDADPNSEICIEASTKYFYAVGR